MTERTYKKDIEVLAENFRHDFLSILNQQNEIHIEHDEESSEQDLLFNFNELLFTNLVPIYNFHSQFLRQLEQRISIW